MKYSVILTETAVEQIKKIRKSGEKGVLTRILLIINELEEHPYSGIGKPKPLSKERAGEWSRRVTHKHRLVYRVEEERLIVLILATLGHYDDK